MYIFIYILSNSFIIILSIIELIFFPFQYLHLYDNTTFTCIAKTIDKKMIHKLALPLNSMLEETNMSLNH